MRIGVSALLLRTEGGFQKAGICRYIIRMLDEFIVQAKHHQFTIFVPHDVELPAEWLQAEHFEFERVVIKNRLHRVWWEHSAPRQWTRLKGLDVWFSTAQCTPFKCGARRVTMIHDLIPVLFPQFFRWEMAAYQKWTLKHSAKAAEAILTNSEASKADIVNAYGCSPDKVVVAPLGPGNVPEPRDPTTVTDREIEDLGIPFKSFLFSLCTLEPRKNLDRLVEAMALVHQDPDFGDVGLAIGGAKGWKESPVFARLRELGIEDRVHFLGYVKDEDLPALFARAEAFIYPSIYEGFGMPVLEAMIMGAPVLCSRQAALTEVAGEAGTFFDPAAPNDIADTIKSFLSEPVRRAEMVAIGRERAKSFSWEQCAAISLRSFESGIR